MEHFVSVGMMITENIVSRIIKRLFYRKKKLQAIKTVDCQLTNDIIKKLSENKKIKVINIDTDFKTMVEPHELARLEKLKTEDINRYNLMVYPIIQKFVNMIFKYYCKKYYIILISDNAELLEFIINNRFITILPNETLFNTLTNKSDLQNKRVEYYKISKDIYEYSGLDDAINFIKTSFKMKL
jgi:hypothetical protein